MATLDIVPESGDKSRMRTTETTSFLRGDYSVEHPDGWVVWCDVETFGAGPGLRAETRLGQIGQPWLVDRKAWDEAHPGVEPTPEALRKAAEAAADYLDDEVCDRLAMDSECDDGGGY